MSNYSSLFYTKNDSSTVSRRPHILGHRWYGHRTNFPGFNYKRAPAGASASTKMYPGARTSGNTNQTIENVYIRGSGVGADRRQVRRYKTIRAGDGECLCNGMNLI
tara:strand:+ start:89 stop:406 length:318 start_codon:yes stop_codon:yes gene_type:complete